AVLLAVRPEGLDLGAAGPADDHARLVHRLADAGAEPGAGDDPDPVQQPGAVPGAAALRLGADRAATDDRRHRLLRLGLGGGRWHPGDDGWRQPDVHRLADPALRAADLRRGAGLGHRP